MKQDFLNYIQETFHFSPDEMKDFSDALSKPLKKTIRVNTNKISVNDFKKLAVENNWDLQETSLWKNMFYIDRTNTEIALWNTLEHIAGYFYVQELAASSSPFYLSEDTIDESEYTILDMSASPWGKTTQLAEYYPNAIIIANELDKSRMRQLHENLDRLWAKNTFVTNYDGRFFKNHPEIFDKILLDAPCSGEGTAYKNDDALKYWNLKNIKRIAKLQFWLLESALIALKVWGELVYSTCTLNRLENEEILNKLTDKYGDYFRIISLQEDMDKPLIRNWPHINNTWWFFVAKLIKKESIPEKESTKKLQKNTQGFDKLSNTSEKIVTEFLEDNFSLTLNGKFFSYRDGIYYSEKYDEEIWENFFLYKCWIKIGKLENGEFLPYYFFGTNFGLFQKNCFEINWDTLDGLYRWEEVTSAEMDGYFQIFLTWIPAWIVKIKWWRIKSLLENRFMRKN